MLSNFVWLAEQLVYVSSTRSLLERSLFTFKPMGKLLRQQSQCACKFAILVPTRKLINKLSIELKLQCVAFTRLQYFNQLKISQCVRYVRDI